MASGRALMDLVGEYGTSELLLSMRFSSGTNATYFMQDYTFNTNTRCIVKTSGTMKKYTCSDTAGDKGKNAESNSSGQDNGSSAKNVGICTSACGWGVRVSIKSERDSSKRVWVSFINDVHSDVCTSTAKPSQRQLTKLATLRAAVLSDRNLKRKTMMGMLQSRDRLNLQFSRSMLYRAKDDIVASADGDWEESFHRLPFMLSDIRDSNPGTTVQLEVDQHRRFLRGFIAFGVNVQCQSGLLPLLGFDGAHMKHSKYNGVVLSLLGRDGNNQNITLATAMVNVESEANILWFLKQCHGAGVQLGDRAIFCDRGKIIGAAPRFSLNTGFFVNLRYCTLHILRNMRKTFKNNGQAFDNAVWAIQGAETHDKYSKALTKMKTDFGDAVVEYLQEIGPVSWTVHANMCTNSSCHGDIGSCYNSAIGAASEAERAENEEPSTDGVGCETCGCTGDANGVGQLNESEFGSGSVEDECECCQFAATRAVSVFQWRTSNFVESDNNALIQNGVRNSDPCSAFYKLTVETMNKLSGRHAAIDKWQKEGSNLTPYAQNLWLMEKDRVGEYTVAKSNMSVSYVSHPGDTTRSREVNVEVPSCTCATFDQMQMACRHIFAALRNRGMEKTFIRAFHPAYLVTTYAKTFADKSVALPVRDIPPGSHEVRPSPFYKQAGRHVRRRIASSGETGAKSTYVCKTCRGNGHNRRTCYRHANECDEANPDLVPCSFELPSIHNYSESTSTGGEPASSAALAAAVDG